jgi:hypothetical protein
MGELVSPFDFTKIVAPVDEYQEESEDGTRDGGDNGHDNLDH